MSLATFDIRDAGPRAVPERARVVAGIDPGKRGAIAWYWPATPEHIQADSLPYVGKELDAAQLAGWLRDMRPDAVFLEQAASRTGGGVTSSFTFGEGYGAVKSVLATLGIPYSLASPAKWKRDLRLSSDKEQSRALAMRTWPSAACLRGPRGQIIEGRAEAALIALWGSRQP